MANPPTSPSAGFKFNSFEEIKSHSSILYNERMAILFYLLDMEGIQMRTYHQLQSVMKVRGILKQIYINIRMLLRYNPTVRATLNLETKDSGIYVPDIVLKTIDKMIEFCQINGYTERKIYIIIEEIGAFESLVKDSLQYFHYFIRPDFKQKPDLEIATERYKEVADSLTLEELRAVVGKKHKIDFAGLGSTRIEVVKDEAYDEIVDGPKREDEEYQEDDEETPENLISLEGDLPEEEQ